MAAHQAPPSLGLSRQEHWSWVLVKARLGVFCYFVAFSETKGALRFLVSLHFRELHRYLSFVFFSHLLKESFGPRKENNSLKGPLLNHLTSERTKHNFSYILMLQASCIYLRLISPCPETYHPFHPPRRLITPCPTASVISTKEYSKYPA